MKFHLKKCLSLALLSAVSLVTACNNKTDSPNYSDDSNWVLKKVVTDSAYDVIFIYGTSVIEPTKDNGVGDICDYMKSGAIENYNKVGEQLTYVKSSNKQTYFANVYIPLYRQMALSYALQNYTKHNDIIDDVRAKEPLKDLTAMLDYYFANCNKNAQKPFVLAGHSQGSAALQVIFEDYFLKSHKSYLKNCVAMYAIGYGISKTWFDGLDKSYEGNEVFHFAKGALDTNCMISWNTEGPNGGDGNFLLPDNKNDTYIINPLNWKVDETPATKDDNLGVLIKNPDYNPENPYSSEYIISTNEVDKFDGTLNLERGSLVVSEPHTGTYINIPPYGPIWGGKSLHLQDGSRFYVNMARNLGDRLDTWFKK